MLIWRKFLRFLLKGGARRSFLNLDTLYAYCGGPVPTEETQQLDHFSRICGGSSTQAAHASKKRRYTFDVQSSGKGAGGSNTRPEVREGATDPPRHGVGKGLMTFQGPIVPPPLPLLVKDKEYAVDTARSIVQDVDLYECFEYETNPLGDSSLHDMIWGLVRMCALQVRCMSREALIKRLNERIGYKANAKQKFKESSHFLF
ncbi:hypothetical protein CMV_012052 [Castanea mollissima]|uniref:Uncharacterized protein n=1 Tax=Castanea mollissima TaxID=60419 RepID=A0A8J4RA54_9ROSI|nr:hypothetical protein CMV_012052 [Castanea mollissima]